MSGKTGAVPVTIGQSKGRDGRIPCVGAGEFIFLTCKRNPGSEENYCGAKGE